MKKHGCPKRTNEEEIEGLCENNQPGITLTMKLVGRKKGMKREKKGKVWGSFPIDTRCTIRRSANISKKA